MSVSGRWVRSEFGRNRLDQNARARSELGFWPASTNPEGMSATGVSTGALDAAPGLDKLAAQVCAPTRASKRTDHPSTSDRGLANGGVGLINNCFWSCSSPGRLVVDGRAPACVAVQRPQRRSRAGRRGIGGFGPEVGSARRSLTGGFFGCSGAASVRSTAPAHSPGQGHSRLALLGSPTSVMGPRPCNLVARGCGLPLADDSGRLPLEVGCTSVIYTEPHVASQQARERVDRGLTAGSHRSCHSCREHRRSGSKAPASRGYSSRFQARRRSSPIGERPEPVQLVALDLWWRIQAHRNSVHETVSTQRETAHSGNRLGL